MKPRTLKNLIQDPATRDVVRNLETRIADLEDVVVNYAVSDSCGIFETSAVTPSWVNPTNLTVSIAVSGKRPVLIGLRSFIEDKKTGYNTIINPLNYPVQAGGFFLYPTGNEVLDFGVLLNDKTTGRIVYGSVLGGSAGTLAAPGAMEFFLPPTSVLTFDILPSKGKHIYEFLCAFGNFSSGTMTAKVCNMQLVAIEL